MTDGTVSPAAYPQADLAAVAEAELARLLRHHPLPARPRLVWKSYRVTAGMAYYRKNAIGLSKLVLRTPEAVRETLGHEYAHLLAVARHGMAAANHGVLWQVTMHELGLAPTVRHRYEVQRNVARQRVTYRCLRCGATIERTRRLRQDRVYVHAPCGGPLELTRLERQGLD